jgi:recombination protein RecR
MAMEVFDRLSACLARLPGIGRRSAERLAVRLVREPDGILKDLQAALADARQNLRTCVWCGAVTTVDQQPCRLCTDPRRDARALCVVEEPNDIAVIERSGAFRGRYHALMGKLSPMRGEGLRHLRLQALLDRIGQEPIEEVILATSTDVEGDATASLVAEALKGRNVRVSRLAFGLPVSSGVAFADPVTLQRAISGRLEF